MSENQVLRIQIEENYFCQLFTSSHFQKTTVIIIQCMSILTLEGGSSNPEVKEMVHFGPLVCTVYMVWHWNSQYVMTADDEHDSRLPIKSENMNVIDCFYESH